MSVLERNAQILRERYPQLVELNQLNNVNTTKALRSANCDLDITSEFSTLARRTPLIFVRGLSNIVTLKALVDYFNGSLTEFIIIEPNLHRLTELLDDANTGPWLNHPRVHWWVNRTTDQFFSDAYEYLRTPSRLFHMKSAKFVTGCTLNSEERGYFEIVADEWLACQKQRFRSLGGIDDSLVGFQNVIRNKDFIKQHPGVNLLKGAFSDLPAVVISTGPSLLKSLPKLREFQNRAVLIAADASLKILLNANITPHFVCVLERDADPAIFFESLGPVRSNLVVFPLVASNVLASYNGPQWVAYRDYGYFYYLENELARGILSSSSSVAHMGMRLAHHLGCHEIALVGQDLAYDPKTLQSHPEGIAVEDWSKQRTFEEIQARSLSTNQGDIFWVEGNDGTPVPTNSTYFSFMKEFSWEAAQLGSTVVNCTQGGAKISNMPWATLEDWGSKYTKSSDCFDRVIELRASFTPGRLEYKEIRQFLIEFSSRWATVVDLIQTLKIQPLEEAVRVEAFRNLRASEKQLLEDTRYITLIIQNAGREYFELVNDLEVLEVQGDTSSLTYQSLVSDLYTVIQRVSMPLRNCF